MAVRKETQIEPLEMKTAMPEMKNKLDKINCRLDITKENVINMRHNNKINPK